MGTIFQVNESNGNTTITGSLTMSSQQIHSVSDPTSAQDAATKNYVDTIAQGITWKASVQAATTAALPTNTYSNGASGVGATLTAIAPGVLTIDGYTVALNDRVLIKNEATAANNGIYFVSTLGTVSVAYILTRTLDYDTPADVVAGTATFVEQGTVNSDSGFVQTTTGTITIGTTALSFTQFTGLGEVTVGTGLSKSGNTISLINPVAVNLGGTGLATLTTHNVLLGEGTSNVSFAAPGSANTALVSNGASSDPTFQAIVNSIAGTTNEITASSSTGSITLSVPSTFIAPGSIAATTTLSGTSETLTATTNQLTFGTTNTVTLSSTAPSASRTYTIPDAGSAANMVLDHGNYTIAGTWSFSNNVTLASSKAVVFTDNTTNTVTMEATNSTTSWTLKLPTTSGSSNFFLQTDGSGNTTWASGGSGTVGSGTSGQNAVYNGTTSITSGATMSMNSTKITSLANGTASTDAAAFGQIGGTLGTNAAGYIKGTIIQYVVGTNTAQTTTTSTSFVYTHTTATITPLSSTSVIRITATGSAYNQTNGNATYITITRGTGTAGTTGGTNLSNSSSGFISNFNAELTGVSMVWIDSPATTSATGYTVQISVSASTGVWGDGAQTTVIVLEEIAQ